MTITLDEALKAHYALHAGESTVTLDDGTKCFIVKSAGNGCRSVNVKGIVLMEQNRTKTSDYAKMARAGKRITWILCKLGSWGLLIEDNLSKPCASVSVTGGTPQKPVAIQPAKINFPKVNNQNPPPRWEQQQNNMIVQNSVQTKRSKEEDNHNDGETPSKKYRVFSLAIEFMEYWSTPLTKTLKIQLYPVDEEYRQVSKLLNDSIAEDHKKRYGYSQFKIVQLHRVQNPDQWGAYYLRKKEICRLNQDNPKPVSNVLTGPCLDKTANEYYFFHGCNEKIADIITGSTTNDHGGSGFDERVSNLSGLFGCGIYFAENSSKSDMYSHSKNCAQVGAFYHGQKNVCTCADDMDAERVMLLTRVCLGTAAMILDPPAVKDPKNPMRRPPPRSDMDNANNNNVPVLLHDSVIGESKKWNDKAYLQFREYIVYDRRQCYGEYIIQYKRVK